MENPKKRLKMKKWMLTVLTMAGVIGLSILYVCSRQDMCRMTEIKKPTFFSLAFEKMNQEDTHVISACGEDVFAVDFGITKGKVDLIIGMNEKTPIYTGRDLGKGSFEVIVPEDGEYRITIKAKRAAGDVRVELLPKEKGHSIV